MAAPVDTAAPPTLLRFGRCELHLPRRELKLGGELQALAPKVHDLLVLLLRHRDRVVGKAELAAALWPGAPPSESVLAGIVLKARRAIGDDGPRPVWIRSVHGVGYRFVGEVLEASEAARETPSLRTVSTRAGSGIGVLPCLNATGEAALDSLQLGLMAAVTQALEDEGRWPVATLQSMLDVAPRATSAALAEEQARFALEALGLAHVLHASVYRQDEKLWLDWRLFGRDPAVSAGSLRDRDVPALARRLAQAVAPAMAGQRPLAPPPREPFARQACERGMELLRQQEPAAAAPLFAVASGLEPDNLPALAGRTASLAALYDPAAVLPGEELLRRAQATGYSAMQGQAHALLAQALRLAHEPKQRAARQDHAEAASRLAAGHEHDDWVLPHRLALALDAICGDQLPQARALLAQGEAAGRDAASSSSSSSSAPARDGVDLPRALLDIGQGQLLQARQRLARAAERHQLQRQTRSAACALALLGWVEAELGLLDTAQAHADDAVQLLQRQQGPGWSAAALACAALVAAERGDEARITRVRSTLESLADAGHPLMQGPWLAIQSCLARCRGDSTAEAALLRAALDQGQPVLGAPWARLCWPLLLRARLAAGEAQAASEAQPLLAPLLGHGGGDVEFRASLLHAQAVQARAGGDAAGAARLLADVIATAPLGRSLGCAHLDAAWLHTEAGDLERAARLMEAAGPWRAEHAAGLAAEARLLFALQQPAQARALQQRALDRHRGPPPAWHPAALRVYAAAAESRPAPLPLLPVLVSESWRAPASAPR